jgi:hypothetical protein
MRAPDARRRRPRHETLSRSDPLRRPGHRAFGCRRSNGDADGNAAADASPDNAGGTNVLHDRVGRGAEIVSESGGQKAGYFRFNNEDRSGAISYENPKYFDTPDPSHPQQLWYDVNGRLLGGDWSQTVAAAPNGPTLFGLSPARFHKIPLHVHYGVKRADGTIDYGLFVRAADFTAAGLDPLHPTAADLVKLGKVTAADQVAFVFALLNNYDAQMWVIPNPNGQFADLNPNVKPSPNQGKAPAERQT